MLGAQLFAIGIYTIIMAALSTEPTVSGGMFIAGLGLMYMLISSRRGDRD